ncbi:carboxypeptidase-like regulatory domain-containing protein [Sphingobacterium sp. KU25419]|nr:carboxypeptidase-like regulatory domain-containing protein [Sphingobacterium sp. KU25419]
MQAKQLFLTGFFLHISLILCAQKIETFNLSGYVKDSFGKPIAGATISIQELDLGTTSDVDGSYQFLKLKQAHFSVRVSSVGFHSDTRKINLETNTNTFLDFQLRRDEKSLDEVSVVGKTLNQRKVQEIKQSAMRSM